MKKIVAFILITAMVMALAGCGSSRKEETTAAETSVETTTAEEKTRETTTAPTTEETTTEYVPQDTIQFYLFGVDTVGYTEVDQGRSDMIKIVQISPEQKSIKFASILRDTRTPITDYDDQKINGAYMLGGPELAMDTINEQFGLDIHKYIMINFAGLVQIIDDFGGIDIEITQDEADIINEQLDGDYVGDGRNHYSQEVSAGTAHLDGSETLAYCRIRAIDSDYFRSGRQNKVLKAIYEKLSKMSGTERLGIISKLFQYIDTNMTMDDIVLWTKLGLEDYGFTALIWPDYYAGDSVWSGIDHTGSWVWIYDLAHAGEEIKGYFGEYWVDPAEPIEVDEYYYDDYYDDYEEEEEELPVAEEPAATEEPSETVPAETEAEQEPTVSEEESPKAEK